MPTAIKLLEDLRARTRLHETTGPAAQPRVPLPRPYLDLLFTATACKRLKPSSRHTPPYAPTGLTGLAAQTFHPSRSVPLPAADPVSTHGNPRRRPTTC